MTLHARKRATAERLPLPCPACQARLEYVRWEHGTHFYRCRRDGVILLTAEGELRRDDPDDTAVRH